MIFLQQDMNFEKLSKSYVMEGICRCADIKSNTDLWCAYELMMGRFIYGSDPVFILMVGNLDLFVYLVLSLQASRGD